MASTAGAQSFEKAGWEAELTTYDHGVSGTVRILDEYTLEFENFSYDGIGINVYFWLDDPDFVGEGVDYQSGVAISPNIKGDPYIDESFEVDTGSVSLADHNGISVWCLAAHVSFGDGVFMPVPEPDAASLQLAAILTALVIATLRRRASRVANARASGERLAGSAI